MGAVRGAGQWSLADQRCCLGCQKELAAAMMLGRCLAAGAEPGENLKGPMLGQ